MPNDPLEKAFGLSPMPLPHEGETTVVGQMPSLPAVIPPKDKLESDADFGRESIKAAMEIGLDAMKTLADIAEASQNEKVYNALTSMMSNIGEMGERLVNIHVRKNTSKNLASGGKGGPATPPPDPSTFNQQNIFVGSTEDLQNYLKDRKDI